MENYEDLKKKVAEWTDLAKEFEQRKLEFDEMVKSMKEDLSKLEEQNKPKIFVSFKDDLIEVLEKKIAKMSCDCFCESFNATYFNDFEFNVRYGTELELECATIDCDDYFRDFLPTSLFDNDDIESNLAHIESLKPIFLNQELVNEIQEYLIKKMKDIDFTSISFDDFEEFEVNLNGTELQLESVDISCDNMQDVFNHNFDFDTDEIVEIVGKYFNIVMDDEKENNE